MKIPSNLWRIDYSNPSNLVNWVDPNKLDLTCQSPFLIGLIGAGYFMGFAISSMFVPALGDKLGRKDLFMFCYLL